MTETTSDASKGPDKFKDDWSEALAFWQTVHRKFDYNYLQYKSIMTYNDVYGQNYLANFGLQVYVPRTFITVESLSASENVKKTQFVVNPNNNASRPLTKYVQKLDNVEWYRSGTDLEVLKARKDSRIFGMSYVESAFIDEKNTFFFPKTNKDEEKKPQDPEDGVPDTDGETFAGANDAPPLAKDGIQWEEREIRGYRGMKGTSWNPYYVFTDPKATCDDDRRFVYLYRAMSVENAREYVVANGWMTDEDAQAQVQESAVEFFDGVRDTIDWMYSMQTYNGFNRGDHSNTDAVGTSRPVERVTKGMCLILERWERDGFEARLGPDGPVLVQTHNYFPHKKIPITTFYDYKVNKELVGMGEPEIMRHQQIEENKIHNLILQQTIKAAAQRYAIDVTYLENENDLYDNDPFKPIRMKAGMGKSIDDVVMAMQQPEVKDSPFKLIQMVQDISQKATAANDFVTSSSEAETSTATESSNLVNATTNRIQDQLRGFEEAVENVINLWHPCYFAFYSEEMDLRITGRDIFIRYLPYNREDMNEDPDFLKKTNEDLHTEGSTVTNAYKLAGYDEVVFLSDLDGDFEGQVKTGNPDQDEQKTIATFQAVINIAQQVNDLAAKYGNEERIDVFKIGKDMMQSVSSIGNIEEYMTTAKAIQSALTESQQPQTQGLGMPSPEPMPPSGPAPAPGMAPAMPAGQPAPAPGAVAPTF